MGDRTGAISGELLALAARFIAAPGEGVRYHRPFIGGKPRWHWALRLGLWEPSSSTSTSCHHCRQPTSGRLPLPRGAFQKLPAGLPASGKSPQWRCRCRALGRRLTPGNGTGARFDAGGARPPSSPRSRASEDGTPKAGWLCPAALPAHEPPRCCEGTRPTAEPNRRRAANRPVGRLVPTQRISGTPAGRGLREPGGGRVSALTPSGRTDRPPRPR